MQVLVVGSVALDTLETPAGSRRDVLGGSAIHFALAASHFSPVRLVGVVGKDFPPEYVEVLRRRGVDTSGLEVAEGRTFRWHGRFEGDMSRAETLSVELNVLERFRPRVPPAFRDTPYVLLGNASPSVQRSVLDQLIRPKFVILDTMDFWIASERAALWDLVPLVHGLCVNHQEALFLTGARSAAEATRTILDHGTHCVVVKRGEHGATLATRDRIFSIPAYPTDRVVDPTGAGDSFAGGMLGYLARTDAPDRELRRALVYGTVMGSLAVEDFGTERIQGTTVDEIDARARAILHMIRVE